LNTNTSKSKKGDMMKSIKYLLIGVLLAFMVDSFTSCKKNESNPVEPDPSKPPETEVINDLEDDALKTIAAFKSGSVDEVKKIISESANAIYGSDLESAKPKFVPFSEALKNKKLIAYSEMYAEYEIIVDGNSYLVAFSKQNEAGDWKLIRF